MLTPDALLRHARRLLAGNADEADTRRAISAAYYAVFHLFITEAAATHSGTSPPVREAIRRSIDHRDVLRTCVAISARPGARPADLQRLLVEPVGADLVNCALNFLDLHAARLTADYDLDQAIMPPAMSPRPNLLIGLAQQVLDIWPTLASDPNARTFLAALLFPKSWTRAR